MSILSISLFGSKIQLGWKYFALHISRHIICRHFRYDDSMLISQFEGCRQARGYCHDAISLIKRDIRRLIVYFHRTLPYYIHLTKYEISLPTAFEIMSACRSFLDANNFSRALKLNLSTRWLTIHGIFHSRTALLVIYRRRPSSCPNECRIFTIWYISRDWYNLDINII